MISLFNKRFSSVAFMFQIKNKDNYFFYMFWLLETPPISWSLIHPDRKLIFKDTYLTTHIIMDNRRWAGKISYTTSDSYGYPREAFRKQPAAMLEVLNISHDVVFESRKKVRQGDEIGKRIDILYGSKNMEIQVICSWKTSFRNINLLKYIKRNIVPIVAISTQFSRSICCFR